MSWYQRVSTRTYVALILCAILVQALVLFLMGQQAICECGYVKVWHGVVFSSENSQHLSDWYTFSHIIHGFLFYAVIRLISRGKWPYALALLIAVIPEIIWEIVENTPQVIQRYRESTIALDYFGDSVVNSLSDTAAAIMGFFAASRLPVWSIIALALAMELVVGYLIHDNLTLNVIMLLHPFESIKMWQEGSSNLF